MTIAYQVNISDLFELPEEVLVPVFPDLYKVKVHKHGEPCGTFKLGQVVSHLEIEDWCDMHGYQLQELYECRGANMGERTELF